MQATHKIELPPKLVPVFLGKADVRGAYGGRGSAKTRSFAKMTAVKALMFAQAGVSGIIMCARQFMNSLEDSSLQEVKEAIASDEWLESNFDVGERYVRTRCGRVSYSFVGLDRNIASVKSKSRILLCWVDEAEPTTEAAWAVLLPTIREENSELWVTWNPESEKAPVHSRFRLSNDPLYKIVELNYTDNPWFPERLERQRLRDLADRPESYNHIWEGGFRPAITGAYYAKLITEARNSGRIGCVPADPLQSIRVFVDIGGTGAKSDAFSMWVAQFVGLQIRVVDYYEAQGQQLADHLGWLRNRGYTPDKAGVWLPHDGATHDKVYNVSYQSAFKDAGYNVVVVPNQGAGAAAARIETVRRRLPACWFNEDTTRAGLDALSWYHEKWDKVRNVGLGADHDWSSHAADAFGLMCIVFKEPTVSTYEHHAHLQRFMK